MLFLCRIYGLLLFLFPRVYREEYGDELRAVFNLSVGDALERGTFEVARVVLRELSGLPQAIIHEHLRERRRLEMNKTFASRFDFAPGSRTESFAALAPFLFGMVMVFFGYIGRYMNAPLWMQVAFVILFWSAVLGLFLLGSAKGLPRWFLPYFGGALLFVAILLFNILVDLRVDVWWHRLSGFLSGFNFGGFLWMGLILLVFLLLVISRLVPRFHPFYQRLRDDWTLLSFLLYGAAPLALWLTFDGYVNEEPFAILSLFMLALGGWFYLRNNEPLKQFVSLHIGLALSMITVAVGKVILYFSPYWLWSRHDHALRWEVEDTLITWLWLAIIMLIPLVLKLFPRSKDRLKVT